MYVTGIYLNSFEVDKLDIALVKIQVFAVSFFISKLHEVWKKHHTNVETLLHLLTTCHADMERTLNKIKCTDTITSCNIVKLSVKTQRTDLKSIAMGQSLND